MERLVRIGIYRILRRFGADRVEIKPDSKLRDLFEIDEMEWTVFMFFIESKFNISIKPEEELKLVTVQNIIDLINKRLNPVTPIYSGRLEYVAEVA